MPLNLTIAIPCHNDTLHLERLLPRITTLGLACNVIVVDDGSDLPVDTTALRQLCGLSAEQLRVFRQEPSRGAGAARNLALEQVRSPYLLFLDADDLPTRELRDLCAALPVADTSADPQATAFDFCLFQHHDSRMERDNLWGQMPFDQALWDQAGLSQSAVQEVPSAAAQLLVQTANYPWNKIYRTAFLRDQAIRCSETLVHNDIVLHWRSFLQARRILVSDHVGVVHFVHHNNRRLTNRQGRERLQIFEPLDQIALEISASQSSYAPAFYRFLPGLLLWSHGTLHPGLQAEFRTLAQGFLHRHCTAQQQKQLAQELRWRQLFSLLTPASPSPEIS